MGNNIHRSAAICWQKESFEYTFVTNPLAEHLVNFSNPTGKEDWPSTVFSEATVSVPTSLSRHSFYRVMSANKREDYLFGEISFSSM